MSGKKTAGMKSYLKEKMANDPKNLANKVETNKVETEKVETETVETETVETETVETEKAETEKAEKKSFFGKKNKTEK